MKLVSFFETKLKQIFEAEEDEITLGDEEGAAVSASTGAKLKAGDTLEQLRDKADKTKKLAKIKENSGSVSEEEVATFEMETIVEDDTQSSKLKSETPDKVNETFKEMIEKAEDDLKASEAETCDVNISWEFINTDVEIKLNFSFDKDGAITIDQTNLEDFKVSDLPSLKKWWADYRWRSLE